MLTAIGRGVRRLRTHTIGEDLANAVRLDSRTERTTATGRELLGSGTRRCPLPRRSFPTRDQDASPRAQRLNRESHGRSHCIDRGPGCPGPLGRRSQLRATAGSRESRAVRLESDRRANGTRRGRRMIPYEPRRPHPAPNADTAATVMLSNAARSFMLLPRSTRSRNVCIVSSLRLNSQLSATSVASPRYPAVSTTG